jgi:restriction endonuclease Mrr
MLDALPVDPGQLAAVSREALSRQTQTVDDCASDYDYRWRVWRALIGQEDERREAVRRLARSLKCWEMCLSPGGAALLCSFGLAMSLLLGLCAGGLVRASFGVLVGFLSACLAVSVPLLVHLNRDWWGDWLIGRRARLDEAQRELEEVAQAEDSVCVARSEWDRAEEEYERLYEVYQRALSEERDRQSEKCARELAQNEARQRVLSEERERQREERERELAQHEARQRDEARQRVLSEERERQRKERERALAQSRQYQLLRCNWRAMRGKQFEDFLQQVFEALGYSAQTTKASGDQGLDLILTGKGRKIGVQAKGYTSKVGNHAVQEAHSGKDYYGCDCCVVITNSNFTRQARKLAARIGCRLISGSEIPDLILGHLPL